MITTLVLGATGRIGSLIAQHLEEAGGDVRRASRHEQGNRHVRFDWDDPATFDAAVDGVERIFVMTPEQGGNLTNAAEELIRAAGRAGVKRIVLLSALGVDLTPDTTGMQAIERLVSEGVEQWSILRPNTFMQNFATGPFAQTIPTQHAIVAPVGDATVSFIDVRDIAACAAAELGNEPAGGVLELTGSAPITFTEAAAMISVVAGRNIGYTDLPPAAMREGLLASGMPEPVAEMILGFYETLASGAHSHVTDTVANLTGRTPITFEQFCADHAAMWASA